MRPISVYRALSNYRRRSGGMSYVATATLLALVASTVTASQPLLASQPAVSLASFTNCADVGTSSAAAAAAKTSSQPDFQTIVQPTDPAPRTIAYAGAKLVIKPSAVRLPTGIGITPLGVGKLPKLDSGMTNVTGKQHGGYRFTPHPMTFAETIEVTLPYDPALLTDDFTAQDVYTYFYDDVALCWQALQRVSVDEVNHTVTSLTDHFTDMINATVIVPEHPEGASFNPNQLNGIQAADPGPTVNLVAPPPPHR